MTATARVTGGLSSSQARRDAKKGKTVKRWQCGGNEKHRQCDAKGRKTMNRQEMRRSNGTGWEASDLSNEKSDGKLEINHLRRSPLFIRSLVSLSANPLPETLTAAPSQPATPTVAESNRRRRRQQRRRRRASWKPWLYLSAPSKGDRAATGRRKKHLRRRSRPPPPSQLRRLATGVLTAAVKRPLQPPQEGERNNKTELRSARYRCGFLTSKALLE
ncbi:hypothetical protein PIB30_071116 [Stylosanthes scabra]|uniref:Uncharacterized protein n=1 Tax=Stylosanthes scabra TaxID=79078 RepID=A0ABU6TPD3_9FABA|nr:hypothetical protein [Stylosanthes scabra]